MWTIELNLDEDYANSCSYHVEEANFTFVTNLDIAISKRKSQRWVIIGMEKSQEEAHKKCELLKQTLCRLGNKTPYGMMELMDEIESQKGLQSKKDDPK